MIICMQKMTFITHFFLKILQRNSKLAILGTLSMSGDAHPKWYYQLAEKFGVYQTAKNQLHPPRFSGDIPKILWDIPKILLLGTLSMPGYAHPKWYFQLVENLSVYQQVKIPLYPPLFSGDIAEIFKFVILYFGHVWLGTPKMIVLTCRALSCLSACQK